MKLVSISLLLFVITTLSGCAFWDGFTRGIASGDPVIAASVEGAGHASGAALVESVRFFPSPWREILIALISGATGWATARKEKEKDATNSRPTV
tara:strand:- start:7070 stop:7354 length:285 start_codon:yes stop_codon:yes gene_type:complete